MKAAVVVRPGLAAIEDRAIPDYSAGALVQVVNAGICGTDLKIVAGSVPVDYPRVIGHEIAGLVAEPGPAGLVPAGTRVVIDPVLSCQDCGACRDGKPQLCARGGLIGRDRDGGLAEYVTVDERQLHVVPDSIDLAVAPLLQVLATCVHAQSMTAGTLGRPATVVGLGVAGLLHVQLLRARGAGPITGISRSAAKQALAGELGADRTAHPADAHDLGYDDGALPPLIVEAAGVPDSVRLATELAGPGSTILCYGTLTATSLELPFYDHYLKELRLQHTRASLPADLDTAISLVARGQVVLEPLVSVRRTLAETTAALDDCADPDRLKIIVQVGQA
jgi:threonine dehydrogenase-like Zn-dependent dehydrogenase